MNFSRLLCLLTVTLGCLLIRSGRAADVPPVVVPAAPVAAGDAPKADELAARWYDTTGTLIERLSSAAQIEKGTFEAPQRQIAALLSEGARTPGFTARFMADSPRAALRFGALAPLPGQVEQAAVELERQRSLYLMAQNDVLIEQNRQIIALLARIADQKAK